MKYFYDLHIHSVVSACADILQTPNNILNMSMLKGLDMIAICDHNSAKQYKTIDKIKDSFDFLVIYGMEVTVKEGFHVLTYFENYDDIMSLDEVIDSSLDKSITLASLNNKALNDQMICNVYDLEEYVIPYYLNQPSISFKELITITKKLGGVVIPAHIDRKGTGILDFINDFSNYDVDGIEIYKMENYDNLVTMYPYLKKYKYLHSSDAHDIDKINEREYSIELDDLSFKSFKKWLKG